jgi:tRNA 2-selenouridine synthase
MFESRLLAALDTFDPARPVLVEAESSKIGDRMIPPALWKIMAAASRIEVAAPLEARVRYLVSQYADTIADRHALETALTRLPCPPGKKTLAAWRALIDQGAFESLAADLLEKHYDPAYDRAARREGRATIGTVALTSLELSDLDRASERIAGMLTSITPRVRAAP